MVCTLCGRRKARRDCPALHQKICAICCGTKRLTEIPCPSGCVHLAVAREHPPAAVRRQQERDAAILVPSIRHLTGRQQQMFVLFGAVIAKHRPDDFGFVRLTDSDVADGAGALAATLETAARGVIYEHMASSAAGQRLTRDLQAALDDAREQAGIRDTEAVPALRAIEDGARRTHEHAGAEGSYVDLMRRILQAGGAAGEQAPDKEEPGSPLIVPGT